MRVPVENLDNTVRRGGLCRVWELVREGGRTRLVARWIERDHDESQAREDRDAMSCDEGSDSLVFDRPHSVELSMIESIKGFETKFEGFAFGCIACSEEGASIRRMFLALQKRLVIESGMAATLRCNNAVKSSSDNGCFLEHKSFANLYRIFSTGIPECSGGTCLFGPESKAVGRSHSWDEIERRRTHVAARSAHLFSNISDFNL
jgi:hypothetical protein